VLSSVDGYYSKLSARTKKKLNAEAQRKGGKAYPYCFCFIIAEIDGQAKTLKERIKKSLLLN
jgi:hypothetical protein